MDPIATATAVLWAAKTVADILAKYTPEKRQVSGASIQSADHVITPAFGRFVTRNKGFLAELLDLQRSVLSYASRQHAVRPMNILLAAEPGAGKSYLIKQLAQSMPSNIGSQYDEYYTVALRDRDDLTAAFHRIQSANLNRKLPFVFFDEIDGRASGRYILADLLAPMWDGVFHSGPESFVLGKAVLVFAASALILPPTLKAVYGKQTRVGPIEYQDFKAKWMTVVDRAATRSGKDIDKATDFLDRIDIRVCIPPTCDVLLGSDDARLETIDILCPMAKKHFPVVDFIEQALIEALIDAMSERRSRRYAESLIFRSMPALDGRALCLDGLPEPERSCYKRSKIIQGLADKYLRIVIEEPGQEPNKPDAGDGK